MARFTSSPSVVSALAVALVCCVTGSVAQTKIMALGDSITGSPGCWRAELWRKLQEAGLADAIDFVGTLPGQGCGFPYDGENEGHGGFLATNIARQNQLVGWLAQTTPDIVMMHLGTNDVWNNRGPAEMTETFSTLLKQMRESKSTIKLLVAQIIPMNPSNCPQCGERVVALNEAIATWAEEQTTVDSPVTAVDCWTGFDTQSMTGDGVHPNAKGNTALANSWYEPLVEALALLEDDSNE